MIKNLVSIGCSWPAGEELIDPETTDQRKYMMEHAYPGLIAVHNNWTIQDLTWNMASLESMEMSLRAWAAGSSEEHKRESLVLMSLTSEARLPADSPFMETDGVSISDNFEKYVNLYETIASEEGLNLVQFKVLSQDYKFKNDTLIESISALEMLVIRNKKRKDPMFSENKHPNEKGHLMLSKFLIKELDSVIIDR